MGCELPGDRMARTEEQRWEKCWPSLSWKSKRSGATPHEGRAENKGQRGLRCPLGSG